MGLSDQMAFNKAIQALKLPDAQFPFVHSALSTKQTPDNVEAWQILRVPTREKR